MKITSMMQYVGVLLGWNRDRDRAFALLVRFGAWILPEYRFAYPQMKWWRDDRFNAYLRRFDEYGHFNTHRRWMLAQLMRLTEGVPGDTAECGVYRGCGSWAMLRMNEKSKFARIHHVFDSFAGVSAPNVEDGGHWTQGDLAAQEDEVRDALGAEGYRLYKGWIPERFPEVADMQFSFIHVDVDLYEPTRASIEFFYERLNSGGILLCDDYGFETCPGATRAVDEFLNDKPEKMVALADGGGFFIKGVGAEQDAL